MQSGTLLALTAATRVAGSTRGNALCFDPSPNWLDQQLTYDECCKGDPATGPDCFSALGGFYTHEFCCEPPVPDGCDWDSILQVVASSEQVGEGTLSRLSDFPVMLREFCCIVPGDEHHPCWHGFQMDTSQPVPMPYVQCCLPVLRRLITSENDPPWLEIELQREFEALGSRRWTSQDLLSYQAEQQEATGNRHCLISIRGGTDVYFKSLSLCCPEIDESGNNDCSYIKAVATSLFIIGSLRPLPDVDLFVSPKNQDIETTPVPVFTRHRPREPRGNFVLLPMEWQLHPAQARKQTIAAQRRGWENPWDARTKGLIWRGSNSNCFLSCGLSRVAHGNEAWEQCLTNYDCMTPWKWSNWLNTPRGRLVFLSQFLEGLDARWTGLSQEMEPDLWRYFEDSNLTADHMSQLRQAAWTYAINIDGTGSGDRVYWQLLTGSLVLVQQSPWVSWLVGHAEDNSSGALVPFKHYLPLKCDLSDLASRLEWLRSHDHEAQLIATAGHGFARRHLNYDGVLLYLDRAVRRYAEHHFDASSLVEIG